MLIHIKGHGHPSFLSINRDEFFSIGDLVTIKEKEECALVTEKKRRSVLKIIVHFEATAYWLIKIIGVV